ncbi:hypothetical protein GCM10022212_04580 [Actimicrobium antarcticum]|uniref:Uncharacterized protein n=1 Tax=Actimicrobium antarcticum TaxID=1051899 RepID=A0ABP7SMQ3_9BURK
MLHFEDIQSSLHKDVVMHRLKLHVPGDDKGAEDAFSVTRKRMDIATERAERLAARFSAHTAPQPFTAIVELVRLLTTLRR